MNQNVKYNRYTDKQQLFNRIALTLGIIALGRFGSFIPIPGINQTYLYQELQNSKILILLSSFSQGNFVVLGLFTLGVFPNINASILIQLSTFVFPILKRLQREEGEFGRQQVVKITRYLTIIIAIQYGLIIGVYLKPFVLNWNLLLAVKVGLTLGTGSLIILFFSEIINEYGIGNGTSLFIFVNISSSLPNILKNNSCSFNSLKCIVYCVVFVMSVFFIIILQNATRKIYLISLKQLSGTSINNIKPHLPFKLNSSGILPLIFASGLVNLLLVSINSLSISKIFNYKFNLLYIFLYFVLTLFFSYFYSTILVDPIDIAKDLKKMAFTIPLITPGLSTIKYLQTLINRLSILGGLVLAFIVSLPNVVVYLNHSTSSLNLEGIGTSSLLILVGVTIDLSRQIQTYRISGSYDNIEM